MPQVENGDNTASLTAFIWFVYSDRKLFGAGPVTYWVFVQCLTQRNHGLNYESLIYIAVVHPFSPDFVSKHQ